MAEIVYTDSYNRRARKFFRKHAELVNQYEKTLKLLEADPFHSSLRLHRLQGRLSDLHSVSINISYRVSIFFVIEEDRIIPLDIGTHDEVY